MVILCTHCPNSGNLFGLELAGRRSDFAGLLFCLDRFVSSAIASIIRLRLVCWVWSGICRPLGFNESVSSKRISHRVYREYRENLSIENTDFHVISVFSVAK